MLSAGGISSHFLICVGCPDILLQCDESHVDVVEPFLEMPRGRFGGSPVEIAAACAPFASEPGWLRYAERHGKGALCPKLIVKNKQLLLSLADLQSNLSFADSGVKSAMKGLAKDKKWDLSSAQVREMSEVTSRRLRLLCRHAQQARSKKRPPPWVAEIFGDDKKRGELGVQRGRRGGARRG